MAQQLKVFVSHSHQDNAFCEELVKALRAVGADVWYDEHDLSAGVLLRDIQKELADRPVFIVVLSKAAFASEWVRTECDWAYQVSRRRRGRCLLPVVAGAYDPNDFDALLHMESMTRVEAPSHKPYPTEQAIERTLRLLTLTPVGAAPTPTAPQPNDSVDDLITKGNAYAAQQEHTKALPFFIRATERNPGDHRAWLGLAGCYHEFGNWSLVLRDVEQAIAVDPHWSLAWGMKVEALVKMGRLEDALAAVDQQRELEGDDPMLLLMRGERLTDLKRYDKALTAYERAVNLDETNAAAWACMSDALRTLGRVREADEAYATAEVFGWPG